MLNFSVRDFSDDEKITWYDLRENSIICRDGSSLIFLALFLPLIGRIARYAPSLREKNSSKI